ncbi:MAG: class Ib ribonucleoside-diphosphate reductase assembly flavoprotein NrdI [Oscillospiraceae bacterium]|nr:class Ib ribonucleoside-diphosphate reductase assembly flavoprotein NrdI [Oscillospiraceae bacterium]
MIIAFCSKTGNVLKFVKKLNVNHTIVNIEDIDTIDEEFIIITYTAQLGEVPKNVDTFITKHSKFLVGVISSGNRSFGKYFANSADIISYKFSVPILHKFESSGFQKDVTIVEKGVNNFDLFRKK